VAGSGRPSQRRSTQARNLTMSDAIIESKAALRREVRARLKTIAPEVRRSASENICARLRELPAWQSARTVLFYAPMPDEPDLWPLLELAMRENKTVALPRHLRDKQCYVAAQVSDLSKDLSAGKFGIREPAEACGQIFLSGTDLVLVPGVAFDLRGRRLGRGRGYYDRLLAELGGIKCGVAFDEQMVEEVPVVPLDAHVDFIVTPAKWIKVNPQ
jgi:5-formyltetrahydrofolate cyclo-ligase